MLRQDKKISSQASVDKGMKVLTRLMIERIGDLQLRCLVSLDNDVCPHRRKAHPDDAR